MSNTSFAFWSYMRTRVITGEGDNILCVNTTLPDEVLGTIRTVDSLDEIGADTYDLILGHTLLSNRYSLGEHFKAVRGHIREDGIYSLAEPITGSDDAWLNTLLFTINPSHIRAPRAEEVIAAAADYFDMLEFLRFNSYVSFEISQNIAESVRAQIDSMPQEIFSRISPTIEGNVCNFNMLTGLFVWQKNI